MNSIITDKQKDIAQQAMDIALGNGCQVSRISLLTGINSSFDYRDQQLDNLHQSTENELHIELYVDDKYSSFSTNRIENSDIKGFILKGIESTKYLAADKCRQLPEISRCYRGSDEGLEMCDKSYEQISPDKKLDLVKQSVEEVYGKDMRVVSTSASYGDTIAAEYMIANNGMEVESMATSFSLSTEVSLKTDSHARSESYWYDSSIYWNDLTKTGLGKIALERALRKIGQKKVKSGKYQLVLDNTVSSRLFFPLMGAISGAALQQKNSFLIDKLGQKICSDKLTIMDKPHLSKSFGARMYDGEGVATSDSTIIENGILKTHFIDTYHALKMQEAPTISGPSILVPNYGAKDFNQIIKSVQKGIWVTGFNGGNTNMTTGDFSFGIEGFLIENGEVTIPISEMNITGNLLVLWSSLIEVGNDPRLTSRSRMPSLLFDDVNFNGL